MARKKEDFELDDWDWDSDLDFGDFDVEAGSIPKDRNVIMSTAAAIGRGAKETALDPGHLKEFMKKSLPKEYGSTFSNIESGMSLGRNLYNDAERELRPVMQEAKRFGKKIMPGMRDYLPSGLAEKLDKFLEENERESTSGPSKEELEEASIANSLGEVFKLQAQEQDRNRKEDILDRRVQETVQAKRHKEGMDLQSSMAKNISRLAQYQDKVTINWQRKTLELQFRQYYLQREQYEEQKKATAIIQTNLEGILKNTGLPDFVKITKTEAGLENLRNRAINSALDGLLGNSDNFIKVLSGNIRSAALNKIRGKKDEFLSAFDMLGSLGDTLEMTKEMGGSPSDMLGEMAGGTLTGIASNKLADRVRRYLKGNPRVARFGHNLQYWNRNLKKNMATMARDGKGEDIPVLGFFASILNEAVNTTLSNDSSLRNKGDDDPNASAFFRTKTQRSIEDIIPGYLARILQVSTAVARNQGVDIQKTSLVEYNWKKADFEERNKVRRTIIRDVYDKRERRDFTNDWSNAIDRIQQNIIDDADEGQKAVILNKEQKDLLIQRLIKMNLNNEVLDPRVLQSEDFWRTTSKTHAPTFVRFFESYLGRAKDEPLKAKGLKRAKQLYKQWTEDQGYSSSKLNQMDDMFQSIGRNLRSKRDVIQKHIDDGHLEELINLGILDRSGRLDERALAMKFYRGYKDTGILDHDGQIDVDENHIQSLEQLQSLTPSQRQAQYRALEGYQHKRFRRANGGFLPYAKGGRVSSPNLIWQNINNVPYAGITPMGDYAGYTGNGSKWETAGTVHAGEIVWSQEDIARFGGVKNVEAIRKFGARALKNITKMKDDAVNKVKDFVDGVGDPNDPVGLIAHYVKDIRAILERGIPVATFTQGDGFTKGRTEVPWYLKSFGSVIGDLAALPFRMAHGAVSKTFRLSKFIGKRLDKMASNAWGFVKDFATSSKDRIASIRDKVADKFDLFVQGELKPRLTRFALLNGQYYNSKGEQIRSWKDIDKDGVYKIGEDGKTWELVLAPDEIRKAFVINYENGKSWVLNKLAGIADFISDRASDFRDGLSMGKAMAYDVAKFTYLSIRNKLYEAQDVYIKDKVHEGPRLLAVIMRKGYYHSQYNLAKTIYSPIDIEGPVVDNEENIVLSLEDLRAGLVDKHNKPLRTGLGKLTGAIGDILKKGVGFASGIGRSMKNAAKSMFGGVKNFFAQFFGDGGLIFANSNKLVDKLDAIYKLLDVRLPGGRIGHDTDGDGDRDGSVKDLRQRNRLAVLARKEKEILRRKEMEERKKAALEKLRNGGGAAAQAGGGIMDFIKEKILGDEDGGVDINIDSDYDRHPRRRKGRLERARQRARIAAKRGARFGKGRLGRLKGMRMPKFGGFGRGRSLPGLSVLRGMGTGGSRLGGMLGVGLKGAGVGAALTLGSMAAKSAGMETLGTGLEYAGTAAGIYTTAQMGMSLLGMGGLMPGIGAAAAGAGSALMGGLATAGTFLLTNPVGWAILGAAAIGAAGYGIYRWMKSNKLGPLGEYRYVQYGLPDGNKDWVSKIVDIENWFEKDKVSIGNTGTEIKDTQVNLHEFFKLFGTDMSNREQCIKVLKWYNERFKPIFAATLTALNKVKPGTKLSEVDSKLSGVEKMRFLQMVELPQGPYHMDVSPFDDLKTLPSGPAEVKAKYLKTRETLDKDLKDSDRSQLATAATATAATVASANALTQAKPQSTPTTEASKTSTETVVNKARAGLAATTVAAGAMTVISANDSAFVSDKDSLSALKAVRMKAYGLNEFDLDKVSALTDLEHAILRYISLTSGNLAQFKGDTNRIAADWAATFGINSNSVVEMVEFENYLANRLLPVLLLQVTTVSKLANSTDVSQTLNPNLTPAQNLSVAQAIIGAKGEMGSVWVVRRGLWPNYSLNTDSGSAQTHLNALKAKMQGTKVSAEEGSAATAAATAAAGAVLSGTERERSEREAQKQMDSNKSPSWTERLGNAFSDTWDKAKNLGKRMLTGGAGAVLMDAASSAYDTVSGWFGGGSNTKVSKDRQKYLDALHAEMKKAGITDRTEVAAFLANIDHETGGLKNIEENTNYKWERFKSVFKGNRLFNSTLGRMGEAAVRAMGPVGWISLAYGGRMGNNTTGDGYKYRGRGLIQLTGKANYEAFSKATGIDVVNNPDLVATDPTVAAKAAIWFWQRNNLGAMVRSGQHIKARQRVNGGDNGMADYKAKFQQYMSGNGLLLSGALKGTVAASMGGKGAFSGSQEDLARRGVRPLGANIAKAANSPAPVAANDPVINLGPLQSIRDSGADHSRTTQSAWGQFKGNSAFENNTGGYANGQVQEPDTKVDGVAAKTTVNENSRAARAANHARARARGESSGYCARYVADALVAGGYKFQRQPSAYMYASNGVMKSMGFQQINLNSTPQKGDVMVWPAHGGKGGGGKHGHIQIFDGTQWLSDFRQRSVIPGQSYRRVKPTLWRDSTLVSAVGSYAAPTPAKREERKPYAALAKPQSSSSMVAADKQQQAWTEGRQKPEIKLGEGTLLENINVLTGNDTYSSENQAVQSYVDTKAEQSKAEDTNRILKDSLKEHVTTNKLLTEIHQTLKGMQSVATPVASVSSTQKEESQREQLVTKSLYGQRGGEMSRGTLNVSKRKFGS